MFFEYAGGGHFASAFAEGPSELLLVPVVDLGLQSVVVGRRSLELSGREIIFVAIPESSLSLRERRAFVVNLVTQWLYILAETFSLRERVQRFGNRGI